MDGWQDGGGDDGVVPLSFLFGGDASWTWGRCVGITGETAIMSKLDALSLHMSPSVSSNPLQSLKLCLVCPSVTRVVLLGVPGKVMASRLAWLSRSLACHSALPLSRAPGGERGEGRPTEAAKVEVLLALCRSLSLCRSLQVTGVWEEPGSCEGPAGWTEFRLFLEPRREKSGTTAGLSSAREGRPGSG